MNRRSLVLSCCAAVASLAIGCDRAPAESDRPRTLAEFEPQLTRRLTPALAREAFGAPDEVTGSGLRIYVYELRAGSRLWLGFPGDAPIVYAKLRAPDGSSTDVPLRP